MKTKKLRILSALLAVAMLFALMPTAAFATDNEPATSGDCGKDGSTVKWELVGDTLTISGEGAMADYSFNYNYSNQPWVDQRTSIKRIVVKNGVTTIGEGAFYRCTNLTEVDMNDALNLKIIGRNAFADCAELVTVKLPQNGVLETIGYCAFSYFDSDSIDKVPQIEEIIIPASVTTIEEYAFDGCPNLTTVIFAEGSKLSSVRYNTFLNCKKMTIYCSDETVKNALSGIVSPDKIKPANLTVTFDSNGGSNVNPVTVKNGKTVSAPAAPTREGYKFMGWYEKIDDEYKPFDFGTAITDNIILYAQWEEAPVDTYVVTVENGVAWVEADAETEAVAAGESISVPEGVTVHVKADPEKFDGMVFGYWNVKKGGVTLSNVAETTFVMPAEDVALEAMPATDSDDSSWDAATIVTGAVIGTGTAILAYHIGTELYAEQVLGKDAVVPRTRGEVALLAWQLAGKPEPANVVMPLTDEAKAQQWAVESGLLKLDAEGNFNAEKKLSKLKALRVLDAAKKQG